MGETVMVLDPERVLVAVLELVADTVPVVEGDPVLVADTAGVSEEELVYVAVRVAVCEVVDEPDGVAVIDAAPLLVCDAVPVDVGV